MVVDEELKMMARICDRTAAGWSARTSRRWPASRTPSTSSRGAATATRARSCARPCSRPTVTGSPLESACRVIARYEPAGPRLLQRVVAALIGRDDRRRPHPGLVDPHPHRRHRRAGAPADRGGRHPGAPLRPGVRGGRDPGEGGRAARRPRSRRPGPASPTTRAFRPRWRRRNATIARFWLRGRPGGPTRPVTDLAGREVLVVDAEDTFTSMIDHQLRSHRACR